MEYLNLTNFPPSRYMTQCHFILGSHAQIKTHAWLILKKMVGSVGFPPLGSLRCQAMNNPAKQVEPAERLPGTKPSPITHIPVKMINTYSCSSQTVYRIYTEKDDKGGDRLSYHSYVARHGIIRLCANC